MEESIQAQVGFWRTTSLLTKSRSSSRGRNSRRWLSANTKRLRSNDYTSTAVQYVLFSSDLDCFLLVISFVDTTLMHCSLTFSQQFWWHRTSSNSWNRRLLFHLRVCLSSHNVVPLIAEQSVGPSLPCPSAKAATIGEKLLFDVLTTDVNP